MEPDMGAVLRREDPAGQCCVKSFGVELIETSLNTFFKKIGINVKFNAEFHGPEHSNECNPLCCEFKQESKGSIFKNANLRDTTTCRINGIYVVYDSTAYVPDCYGRRCTHFDDREYYNNDLGTYEGRDFPGLNNVEEGDNVDVRMEFNSYIEDICSNTKEVKESKYWGFHVQGIVPEYPDSLNVILLGEINK